MKNQPTVDIRMRLGKAVKYRRKELEISQEELAERADLHRTYISDLERGKRNVSIENIEKLANALNLSISELLQRVDEQ
jgi:transcriptional regulator with XRE-family HTH domain